MAEYKQQLTGAQRKAAKYVSPDDFKRTLLDISKGIEAVHRLQGDFSAAVGTSKTSKKVSIDNVGTFSRRDVTAYKNSLRKHVEGLKKIAVFIKKPSESRARGANTQLKDPYFISDQLKNFVLNGNFGTYNGMAATQLPQLQQLLQQNILSAPIATALLGLYANANNLAKNGRRIVPDQYLISCFGGNTDTKFRINGQELNAGTANDWSDPKIAKSKRDKMLAYFQNSNQSAFARLSQMYSKPSKKTGAVDNSPVYDPNLGLKWTGNMTNHNLYRIPNELVPENYKPLIAKNTPQGQQNKRLAAEVELAISGSPAVDGSRKRVGGFMSVYKAAKK